MQDAEFLNKFKQLYRDEFGVDISDADAEALARLLVNLYKAVYGSLVDEVKDASTKLTSN